MWVDNGDAPPAFLGYKNSLLALEPLAVIDVKGLELKNFQSYNEASIYSH